MSEKNEIECAMAEVQLGDGDTISGHDYGIPEVHKDCTVEILTCSRCGHVNVGWYETSKPPGAVPPVEPWKPNS